MDLKQRRPGISGREKVIDERYKKIIGATQDLIDEM